MIVIAARIAGTVTKSAAARNGHALVGPALLREKHPGGPPGAKRHHRIGPTIIRAREKGQRTVVLQSCDFFFSVT